MARANKRARKEGGKADPGSQPKFPYTTKPASLRRFLKVVPDKPRPTRIDLALLKSWGFSDNNDASILRVLRAVNLTNEKGETTELYKRFMVKTDGARALAPEIRRVYEPLFQASHAPYNESSDFLKNLFNIHSGGGERTLEQQIQTFKALCDNADFDAMKEATAISTVGAVATGAPAPGQVGAGSASIQINVHIHLPENKTSRDYQNIIEDIGRHIFGRNIGGKDGA